MHRVHVVGHGSSEVRIYPLRRKRSRYRSYQVRWYELGEKQTKTLADPQKAKAYAQQVHISLLNGARASEITPLDISVLRDAESIAAKFGVSLPFAIREWADTRQAMLGAPVVPKAGCMAQLLKELTTVNAQAAAKEDIKLKEESGLSPRYSGPAKNSERIRSSEDGISSAGKTSGGAVSAGRSQGFSRGDALLCWPMRASAIMPTMTNCMRSNPSPARTSAEAESGFGEGRHHSTPPNQSRCAGSTPMPMLPFSGGTLTFGKNRACSRITDSASG